MSKHGILKPTSWFFFWPPMAEQRSKPNQTEPWDSWTALTADLEISGYNLLSVPMLNM